MIACENNNDKVDVVVIDLNDVNDDAGIVRKNNDADELNETQRTVSTMESSSSELDASTWHSSGFVSPRGNLSSPMSSPRRRKDPLSLDASTWHSSGFASPRKLSSPLASPRSRKAPLSPHLQKVKKKSLEGASKSILANLDRALVSPVRKQEKKTLDASTWHSSSFASPVMLLPLTVPKNKRSSSSSRSRKAPLSPHLQKVKNKSLEGASEPILADLDRALISPAQKHPKMKKSFEGGLDTSLRAILLKHEEAKKQQQQEDYSSPWMTSPNKKKSSPTKKKKTSTAKKKTKAPSLSSIDITQHEKRSWGIHEEDSDSDDGWTCYSIKRRLRCTYGTIIITDDDDEGEWTCHSSRTDLASPK